MSTELEQVIREGVDEPEAEPANKQKQDNEQSEMTSKLTFGSGHLHLHRCYHWLPVTCWSKWNRANAISSTCAVPVMAS